MDTKRFKQHLAKLRLLEDLAKNWIREKEHWNALILDNKDWEQLRIIQSSMDDALWIIGEWKKELGVELNYSLDHTPSLNRVIDDIEAAEKATEFYRGLYELCTEQLTTYDMISKYLKEGKI